MYAILDIKYKFGIKFYHLILILNIGIMINVNNIHPPIPYFPLGIFNSFKYSDLCLCVYNLI